jgi:parvulin-like peptidyl-prolyl isomerase
LARALDLLVARRVVEGHLRREGHWPADFELEAALERVAAVALRRYASLEEYLAARGLTPRLLRRQVAWRLGWGDYLTRHLTDEARQAFFDAHRREFDGTELGVSHILLAAPDDGGQAAVEQLVEQARRLRARIVGGEVSFAEAARRHSRGPSREQGGDLGFIRRHGVMPEAFARAAFALAPGQISEPVVTRFGVHLIQCTAVREGTLGASDARQQIDPRLKRHLFESLAADQRAAARIEFTGASPYLDPRTGEVVE